MDIVAVCVIDSEENCEYFKQSKGYEVMLSVVYSNNYLRCDAIKVLSFALTKCPDSHAYHLITEAKCLPLIFSLLMQTKERKSKRGQVYFK
jgi:hypothetical protein